MSGEWDTRLDSEIDDLGTKLSKLTGFIHSDEFEGLSTNHQHLLVQQQFVMKAYLEVLHNRASLIHSTGEI